MSRLRNLRCEDNRCETPGAENMTMSQGRGIIALIGMPKTNTNEQRYEKGHR
jgi:hypothetical protein